MRHEKNEQLLTREYVPIESGVKRGVPLNKRFPDEKVVYKKVILCC